jgi:hypothetical protein
MDREFRNVPRACLAVHHEARLRVVRRGRKRRNPTQKKNFPTPLDAPLSSPKSLRVEAERGSTTAGAAGNRTHVASRRMWL